MSKWRPEGWKNPRMQLRDKNGRFTAINLIDQLTFELGADAMLYAIRQLQGIGVNLPDDPEPEVDMSLLNRISDRLQNEHIKQCVLPVFPDNYPNLFYQSTHQAAKVVDTGFLCPQCGKWFSWKDCHQHLATYPRTFADSFIPRSKPQTTTPPPTRLKDGD
jgi:hypothetical protein